MIGNLNRRVSALEGNGGAKGAVLLLFPGQTNASALASHQARYGRQEGEPLFIRVVGVGAGR